MSDVLTAVREALHSTEYRCPGGHRLDGGRGDRYDFADEMMDEMGFPADWNLDNLAAEHPAEWKALLQKQSENWVERGRCDKTVEIYMEYDGEYGEISYPVADGPCAEALGVDCDEDYDHPLWLVAAERRRLARILRDAEYAYPDLEILNVE